MGLSLFFCVSVTNLLRRVLSPTCYDMWFVPSTVDFFVGFLMRIVKSIKVNSL